MILSKKGKPADLHPRRKHDHLEETLVAISPIIVIIMVFILIILMISCWGTVFSTEANRYEHLTQIVLFAGGRF